MKGEVVYRIEKRTVESVTVVDVSFRMHDDGSVTLQVMRNMLPLAGRRLTRSEWDMMKDYLR